MLLNNFLLKNQYLINSFQAPHFFYYKITTITTVNYKVNQSAINSFSIDFAEICV
ncbi:hypothetical protein [Tenacibaculum finnmarkense]|uniref:hypothetical protein n=1 Tax=Tenacibaculum finnmarkense TaxID=2781243 RepID=UPI00374E05B7